MDPDTLTKEIRALRNEVTSLNQQRFFRSQNNWWSLAFFNLVRGLFFGLGSVLGATLLVYLLVFMLAQIDFIPIIGNWVHQIIGIIQASPH